jgi:urease accessory protein UreH
MYEALNRTMQSQTKAFITQHKQKAEHSMTEVNVQNFLFYTLTNVQFFKNAQFFRSQLHFHLQARNCLT